MTELLDTSRLVHKHIYDPSGPSIFKVAANERAKCTTITCELGQCSLRDCGQCLLVGGFLAGKYCPYGKVKTETGFTKRARQFHQWIIDRQSQYSEIPSLNIAPKKIAFVGEYVMLPYRRMASCSDVPMHFDSHGDFSTQAILHVDDWHVDNILKLVRHKPRDITNYIIRSYSKEVVPLFLSHLKECDCDMWDKLITEAPEFDIVQDYVGRKAKLFTLKAPITIVENGVHWDWDGKVLTANSANAVSYAKNPTSLKSAKIVATPKEDAVVKVVDNAWVTSDTVFAD